MKKINVLVISHLFPGKIRKFNPNKGIFVKELLKGYSRNLDTFLYVPIDIMPGIKPFLKTNKSAFWVLNEIIRHIGSTLSKILVDFDDPVKGKYIRFISLPLKSITPFWSGICLFIILTIDLHLHNRKFYFDIIHAHTAIPDGLAAVLLSKLFKRHAVVTVHGSDVHSIGKNIILKRTVQYTLNAAHSITCVSEDLKKKIIQLGIREEKIRVISNGVNLEFLNKPIKNIRIKLGISDIDPIILSVTRFVPVKDPFTLIKAFSLVRRKIQNAHLVIVGDKAGMEKEIYEYLHENNLVHCVHLCGTVPHSEVPSFMAACDVFCLSSLREGFPTVLFEALGFGKPIIATKVGGIPEAIYSDDYGILVEPKQPHHLSEAIIKGLNKRWNHEKIIDYAKNNSWTKVANKYYDIYSSLAQKL